MIRAAPLSAIAMAAILAACASTTRTTSDTYVRERAAGAPTATYYSNGPGTATPVYTSPNATATGGTASALPSGSTAGAPTAATGMAGSASSTPSSALPSDTHPNNPSTTTGTDPQSNR